LRLSSLEPWDLDEDFFQLWEDRRMCRSLHLPLQSGCAATLRRMSRRITPDSFRALVHAVRSQFPDVAITTDVIAGFPGETEDEFRTSLDFVRDMEFAGGHAFTYSPMAGTGAVRMSGQVPADTRRQRTGRYLELFQKSSEAFRATQLGTLRQVLWESASELGSGAWEMGGLTDNYVRVKAQAAESRWNRIDPVLLRAQSCHKVSGIIVESG
jgi:threonylcarbamoyladenosine tRNA methylthiotransferase MtaB